MRLRWSTVLTTSLTVLAVWLIARQLEHYGIGAIIQEFERLPAKRLLLGVATTLGCYLLLSAYDILAFRYIGRTMALGWMIFGAFLGFAFSNNFSGGNLTGAALRYRVYSVFGITTTDVTRMAAFYVSGSWLGFFLAAGLAFVFSPVEVLPRWIHLPPSGLFAVGAFLLVALAAVIAWRLSHDQPLKILRWSLPLPSRRLMAAQIGVAGADWFLTGIVPYFLLITGHGVSYGQFLSIYLLAHMAAIISHVPGGLGVFEAVMMVCLAPHIPPPAVAAGLVAYRVLYFFMPFGLAAAGLGAFELRKARARP